MLIVLGYCRKDYKLAINLFRWIAELDGKQTKHELLLVAAGELNTDVTQEVFDVACTAFTSVRTIKPKISVETGWPGSCNYLFRTSVGYIVATGKWKYFQWMEPDCIMLRPGAFDATESAYLAAKMPFLGNTVHKPVNHLPGNAVYPSNMDMYNQYILQPTRIDGKDIAWDCINPQLTLKHTHHSELFQHIWIEEGTEHPQTFPDEESLSIIRKDAVFFHRNKDHTLIDRLREKLKAPPERIKSQHTVYAYYEELNRPEEMRFIDLWKKSWETHGWNPVLIGDTDTEGYPGKAQFLKLVSKLPSVNPKGYDMACYKRWMAMVSMGGGLMVDYDVINYGFTPEMANVHRDDSALIFFEERVPCAVLGSKEKFKFAADCMKSYSPVAEDVYGGRPHVSDMTILQRLWSSPWIKCRHVVKQFGEPDWDKALLVHYSNGSTNGDKVAAIKSRK